MAYNTAAVMAAVNETDGRTRLDIQYTGNAGEPPVMQSIWINQASAPGANYVRGQAMNYIAQLNTNRGVITALPALPFVLDTTTALPAPSVYGAYMAASLPFTVTGATPQDLFTITGSSTKTISVIKTGIVTTQTTAGSNNWFLAKRSTASTGGTSAAVTAVPTDDTYPAATASVLQYTVCLLYTSDAADE